MMPTLKNPTSAWLINLLIIISFASCTDHAQVPSINALPVFNPSGPLSNPSGISLTAGERFLDCSQLGTGPDDCHWAFRFDPTLCANQGCDKLMIFFSGGLMECIESILEEYAKQGYVAVCANTFEPHPFSNGTLGQGPYPFNQAKDRVRVLIESIRQDPVIRKAFSGEYLFFSGVSYGATVVPNAMANTQYDDDPLWQGSKKTAACFYDGIYDIETTDNFLDQNQCYDWNTFIPIVSHERFIHRYGQVYQAYHDCGISSQCACAPNHSPDMDLDTIFDTNPKNLAISNWKLIGCGSSFNRNSYEACNLDAVPDGPVQAFCLNVDNSPNHNCTYESLANLTHIQCAYVDVSACLDWFEQIHSSP